jgi:hypothetical protein
MCSWKYSVLQRVWPYDKAHNRCLNFLEKARVKMKKVLPIAVTFAFMLGASCAGFAQSAPTDTATQPMIASAGPATAPAADTKASSKPAQPEQQLTVSQEIDALKTRIEQLEAEVKEEKAQALADSQTTAELKAAEHELVAGNGSATMPTATTGISPSMQAPAAAAAPAAPAPPEISAERLTKEAPFPGDWTWLNSNGHATDSPMSTKYFTPEFRADANYTLDMNHPDDDSLGGSTETFRSDEFQLEQVSIGGDIRIDNVRGRILFMNGLFATTTPRNDGSVNRGQWDLADAYRYISEGWGGYHWDVAHGLNVDAGIFVSYIGLFSYYNFDNWTYQPSFVSSNTPWFFNGLRIQYFPTAKLKIEPWIINGWQSYARYNGHGGLGGQILWRPNPNTDVVFNNYGMGEDDAGYPGRSRIHADYSVQQRFFNNPKKYLDQIAWTITGDLGCEYGGGPVSFATPDGALNPNGLSPLKGTTDTYNGGVDCHGSKDGRPKQMFAGWMSYLRFWWDKNLFAMTLGGGEMNNPGRYLTLLPPINGATAVTGTPYYTENAGDRAQMHDGTITLDYMPSQFITFRLESGYRYSDTPYWTGRGGITPPGGNNGNPAHYQCSGGGDAGYGYGTQNLYNAELNCGAGSAAGTAAGLSTIWWPDLRTNQTVLTGAVMVRF